MRMGSGLLALLLSMSRNFSLPVNAVLRTSRATFIPVKAGLHSKVVRPLWNKIDELTVLRARHVNERRRESRTAFGCSRSHDSKVALDAVRSHSNRGMSAFASVMSMNQIAIDSELAPVIAFPGGGIYFWWQAGAVKSLQKHYNMSGATLMGASAGSLSAALAACNVDMDQAFQVAQRLAYENQLWERKGGLMGIWGDIIRQWLEELIPEDAAQRCSGRMMVSVAQVKPSFKALERFLITEFDNKTEFIEACLTSVHIPFFLDGKPFREYRGFRCVDGSVTSMLRGKIWHVKPDEVVPTMFVDYKEDIVLRARKWGFLETISEEAFQEMFEMGYNYMENLHRSGELVERDATMRLIMLNSTTS